MLSTDELANGMTFILKLQDSAGTPIQWVQTLRGAIAKRWYDIYRRSDWVALRTEAASVFLNCVTEVEAEHKRKSGRCVVIKTQAVKANELVGTREDLKAP
jgi:hypothetical protein